MECIFCKIIKGEIPSYKVYEDENFVSFLDIDPVNLGHALIVPKTHFKNIFDAPENILSALGPVIKKVSLAVQKGTGAQGINVMMNNEGSAGQLVDHAHMHIIPRFPGDGFEHWRPQEGFTESDFEQKMEKIKENI